MVKLKIVDVDNNKYKLEDLSSNETYLFTLRFYGLEQLPKAGDVLGFHGNLLNKNYEEYNTTYQFGPLNEPYGRVVKDKNDVDCILLEVNDEKIYLKRFFG